MSPSVVLGCPAWAWRVCFGRGEGEELLGVLFGEMPILGKSGGRLRMETAESGERNNVEWLC